MRSHIKNLKRILGAGKSEERLITVLKKVETQRFKLGGCKKQRLEVYIEKQKEKKLTMPRRNKRPSNRKFNKHNSPKVFIKKKSISGNI